MAAISQVIPNLLGGVSQQADPLKLPGQVREAENTLLDPTFGCRKRPPTSFIAQLDEGIPTDAKWFNIFRDSNERYVVAVYKESDATKIRVWEADTGTERTVTISSIAGEYLKVEEPRSIQQLTINDYTLLSNAEKLVTMSSDAPEAGDPEALVVINQVAFNTTYTVDFLRDGQDLEQVKVYRAKKLSISPGNLEITDDGGSCELAGSDTFNENRGPDKQGLGFTITARCTPTLVNGFESGVTYPKSLTDDTASQNKANGGNGDLDYGSSVYGTLVLGSPEDFAINSYGYHSFTNDYDQGSITVRCEFKVQNHPTKPDKKQWRLISGEISAYSNNPSAVFEWREGQYAFDKKTLESNLEEPGIGTLPAGATTGVYFVISTVGRGDDVPTYKYKSVYKTTITLNNGGRGWRKGDTLQQTAMGYTYDITVEEEEFGYAYESESSISYTTPTNAEEGTLDVGDIVAGLAAQISALGEYTATTIGNVIHIKRDDGRDFNLQTKGGTTNNALYGIKNSVNDVSLLPTQCFPDMVLLVRNSAESDADDYYVRFKSSAGDIPGQGAWEETHKPGITTDLNPSTMPVALIRQADGTFSCDTLAPTEGDDALTWASREVGDEDSNPDPSFVGKPVKDMFFFMNRLGFLSEDSVILSQPGDYFNFFVGSAIAVSDADPIDMTASSTKPAKLKAALGTPKGLLLFAENSQFLLSTSEAAFGPSTVKMNELSNYSYSSNVQPLETGVSVMFSTEADTFSKVYEMAVDSIDNRPLVSENTRIVPEYIPPGLTLATSSANNSIVFYGDGSETLYTFKFFNTGNERSLAGWSKWIMPGNVELFAFDHDTGYLVISHDGKHILSKMEMLDDPKTSPITAFGSKFAPRLDNTLLKTQVTTSYVDGRTTRIRFPEGSYVKGMSPNIIVTQDSASTLYRSPEIQEDGTGYYIDVDTYIAEGEFLVGLEYNMKVVLPSFYVTQEKKADRKNVPMVENVYLDLYYSGRYDITVKRKGYVDRTVDLDVTSADLYEANSAAVDEVTSKEIPVYCRGDFVKLEISAPDPLPAAITSYRWEGHYNNRGIALLG